MPLRTTRPSPQVDVYSFGVMFSKISMRAWGGIDLRPVAEGAQATASVQAKHQILLRQIEEGVHTALGGMLGPDGKRAAQPLVDLIK